MTTERSAYDCGRDAALRGCYRVLCCPDSLEQEDEWKRGWDSVPPEERGTLPLTETTKGK